MFRLTTKCNSNVLTVFSHFYVLKDVNRPPATFDCKLTDTAMMSTTMVIMMMTSMIMIMN